MTFSGRPSFPFTAIVGQEAMKLALLLNAVNPRIGGVLIRGEKGAAKSTAVRALARLLPEIEVVEGCHFGCNPADPDHWCTDCRQRSGAGETLAAVRRPVPLVNLPIGATEDRVVGSLDLERALKRGERAFEPGLLAAANRGLLYVDETNLLSDHLVDLLLDAAAMGINFVEREGVSFSHPAQFILVGTMNPEEGELRPQLLDRFGLAVDVVGLPDPTVRAEVVRRRIAFDNDAATMFQSWSQAEEVERARLLAARARLSEVVVPDRMLELISHICASCRVDGLRADIVMHKTAQAIAAYEGADLVSEAHVKQAAELALPHRRRQPMDHSQPDGNDIDRAIESFPPPPVGSPPDPQHLDRSGGEPGDGGGEAPGSDDTDRQHEDGPLPENSGQLYQPGDPFAVRAISTPRDRKTRLESGRRADSFTTQARGKVIGFRIPAGPAVDIAILPTLRAAAVHQHDRRMAAGAADPSEDRMLSVLPQDMRSKVRQGKVGSLILFLVDASGSMGANRRMSAAKGAVHSLLLDAYHRRDRVALIAFRGAQAELLLEPTSSVDRASRTLETLRTGGRTPLPHALELARETLLKHRRSYPDMTSLLVLLSDGRANVSRTRDVWADCERHARRLDEVCHRSILVDTEEGPMRIGLAHRLAGWLGAECRRMEDLAAGPLRGIVRDLLSPRGSYPLSQGV